MKKTLLAAIAGLIAVSSCKKSENHVQKAQAASEVSLLTLNGIAKDAAFKMMKYHLDFRDNDWAPRKTSVWFDSTTINRIVRLLQSEGADGIRIYFVSEPGVSTSHLKNSIVLVSTKANGENVLAPSGMRHADYYEHSSTDILFSNLNAIKGISSYSQDINSAVLYKTCGNCNIEQPGQEYNRHHISRSTAEQMVQKFGDHPINIISEWFDFGLFKAISDDKNYDGLRIYFATTLQNTAQPGSDAFVIIKTVAGKTPGAHLDYFGNSSSNGIARPIELADGGQDTGELCPDNCN